MPRCSHPLLQLYGNPLEYLPELAPAVGLRSLSLANVRILADKAYSRWVYQHTADVAIYMHPTNGITVAVNIRAECSPPICCAALLGSTALMSAS
jgi:hypothetical protein